MKKRIVVSSDVKKTQDQRRQDQDQTAQDQDRPEKPDLSKCFKV